MVSQVFFTVIFDFKQHDRKQVLLKSSETPFPYIFIFNYQEFLLLNDDALIILLGG